MERTRTHNLAVGSVCKLRAETLPTQPPRHPNRLENSLPVPPPDSSFSCPPFSEERNNNNNRLDGIKPVPVSVGHPRHACSRVIIGDKSSAWHWRRLPDTARTIRSINDSLPPLSSDYSTNRLDVRRDHVIKPRSHIGSYYYTR